MKVDIMKNINEEIEYGDIIVTEFINEKYKEVNYWLYFDFDEEFEGLLDIETNSSIYSILKSDINYIGDYIKDELQLSIIEIMKSNEVKLVRN